MLKTKQKNNEKGMTLIELMIVLIVIGILAAVGMPKYRDFQTNGAVKGVQMQQQAVKTAIMNWQNDNGAPSTAAGTALSLADLDGSKGGKVYLEGLAPPIGTTVSLVYDPAYLNIVGGTVGAPAWVLKYTDVPTDEALALETKVDGAQNGAPSKTDGAIQGVAAASGKGVDVTVYVMGQAAY